MKQLRALVSLGSLTFVLACGGASSRGDLDAGSASGSGGSTDSSSPVATTADGAPTEAASGDAGGAGEMDAGGDAGIVGGGDERNPAACPATAPTQRSFCDLRSATEVCSYAALTCACKAGDLITYWSCTSDGG